MKRSYIAISDPNQLFREGIQHLLRRSQFEVVTAAKTLTEALGEASGSPRVDLVICGLDPDSDFGPQLAELDRTRSMVTGARFVVLAHAPDRNLLCRAVAAGVDAVLSKDISGEILQRSLELVMLGQQLFPALAIEPASNPTSDLIPFPRAGIIAAPVRIEPPDRPARLVFAATDQQRDVLLSEREAQILQCLVNGSSNKMIARELNITEATVKVHIKGLLRKVRANNRTQAAIWGVNNGCMLERKQAQIVDLAPAPTPARHAAN